MLPLGTFLIFQLSEAVETYFIGVYPASEIIPKNTLYFFRWAAVTPLTNEPIDTGGVAMNRFHILTVSALVTLLTGCGTTASVADMKSTLGMSKDQVESKFGRPVSSTLEASPEHPGGYWVYNVKAQDGSQTCRLNFDVPHRVLDVDCST